MSSISYSDFGDNEVDAYAKLQELVDERIMSGQKDFDDIAKAFEEARKTNRFDSVFFYFPDDIENITPLSHSYYFYTALEAMPKLDEQLNKALENTNRKEAAYVFENNIVDAKLSLVNYILDNNTDVDNRGEINTNISKILEVFNDALFNDRIKGLYNSDIDEIANPSVKYQAKTTAIKVSALEIYNDIFEDLLKTEIQHSKENNIKPTDVSLSEIFYDQACNILANRGLRTDFEKIADSIIDQHNTPEDNITQLNNPKPDQALQTKPQPSRG